ncbi:hypothetical protein HPB47_013410 [Ixodes persulcatus]|nr:hypothetical protein HPB47_013410 [Ixodes persulcatus]
MHALMAEEFRREAEQEDDPEGAVDNGGSDANTDCDGNDSDANNTDEELRTANEFHWPLDMLQEQFRILQSRIVDEVRRAIREEFDEMRSGMATPPGSPAPSSPVPPTCFEGQFKAFAKFGDSKSTGDAITLSNSDKWFKQAKVIDGKKITTTDTGIYFKQVAKTKKALLLKEYQQFLEVIAKNKKVEVEEIKNKLSSCGPPATTRTTPVATGGAVARLTDHTKYTGTHKQRFDQTGKGKGKEGREDLPSESGYVSGYKDEGNYNKTH